MASNYYDNQQSYNTKSAIKDNQIIIYDQHSNAELLKNLSKIQNLLLQYYPNLKNNQLSESSSDAELSVYGKIISPLLLALKWKGTLREICEALPVYSKKISASNLGADELEKIIQNLGYRLSKEYISADEIKNSDLPTLFIINKPKPIGSASNLVSDSEINLKTPLIILQIQKKQQTTHMTVYDPEYEKVRILNFSNIILGEIWRFTYSNHQQEPQNKHQNQLKSQIDKENRNKHIKKFLSLSIASYAIMMVFLIGIFSIINVFSNNQYNIEHNNNFNNHSLLAITALLLILDFIFRKIRARSFAKITNSYHDYHQDLLFEYISSDKLSHPIDISTKDRTKKICQKLFRKFSVNRSSLEFISSMNIITLKIIDAIFLSVIFIVISILFEPLYLLLPLTISLWMLSLYLLRKSYIKKFQIKLYLVNERLRTIINNSFRYTKTQYNQKLARQKLALLQSNFINHFIENITIFTLVTGVILIFAIMSSNHDIPLSASPNSLHIQIFLLILLSLYCFYNLPDIFKTIFGTNNNYNFNLNNITNLLLFTITGKNLALQNQVSKLTSTPQQSAEHIYQQDYLSGHIDIHKLEIYNNHGNNYYNYLEQNLSLTINAGEILAITNNKLRIINYLLQLEAIDNGNIFIDGIQIGKIQPDILYRNMGYLDDNNYIINSSVIDNIRISLPESDERYIIDIMEFTGLMASLRDLSCDIHSEIELINNNNHHDIIIINDNYQKSIEINNSLLLLQIYLSRILLKEPTILIIRSPEGYLASEQEKQYMADLLLRLKEYMTIIIASDDEEFLVIADYVI